MKSNFTKRIVTIPWTDIFEMFKDYLGEENVPWDSVLKKVRYEPLEKGKISFIVESNYFKDDKPVEVKFDLTSSFPRTG